MTKMDSDSETSVGLNNLTRWRLKAYNIFCYFACVTKVPFVADSDRYFVLMTVEIRAVP